MTKVSIALRGWRFDEDAVFDESGDLKALAEMPEDTRHRIIRLAQIAGDACDACWLVHGEADVEAANPGDIVYGEPMAEVVLCDEHEADFLFWFREAGGSEFAGEAEFPDRFHEWFAAGNRAQGDYGGIDHVEEDPSAYSFRAASACGLDGVAEEIDEMDRAEADAADVDVDALDL
jgi:hypothetical protein